MPTRSAPSSLALCLTSSAVRGWRKMPTMLEHSPIPLLFCTLRGGSCRALLLHAFELLQLPRHDPFVTFRPDPANVPVGKSAASLAAFSCRLHFLGERDLLRCLLRDELLWPGEVRVIVVADWTDRQASRAITEGADYAQQPLPEAEEIPRSRHCDEIFRRRTLRLRIHGAPENFRIWAKPNSCACSAQPRLSIPNCSTASPGQECRQRLHDSPMHTCSVIGRSASSLSSVSTPVR